jgi:hypothetical protein
MAIEDIIQIKESVKENPMGDEQNINQAEFLRFLDEMGLGMDGVMAKIIQMFVEAPSDFTRKFGVEAAESVREFLDLTTQKELEEQGKVFAPNSAEIIGQNISFRAPENSAIGTLQTDQADQSEMMMEFLQRAVKEGEGLQESLEDQIGPKRLLRAVKEGEGLQESLEDQIGPKRLLRAVKEGEGLQESLEDQIGPKRLLRAVKEDFNPKDYREGYLMLMNNLYPDTDREVHAQEYDNWFKGGEGSEYYEDRKNRLLKLLSNMPGGGAGHESAEDYWKRAHPDQFDKEGKYIGKKEDETQYDVDKLNKYVEEQLNAEPGTYRVLSDEEVEVLGYPTKDGQIYEMDEVTNDVRLKEPGLIEGGLLKLLDWFKYGTTDRESR